MKWLVANVEVYAMTNIAHVRRTICRVGMAVGVPLMSV